MCGRYTLSSPGPLLAELFELADAPALAPRFNVAPSQTMPVIRATPAGRAIAFLRWGLVPAWSQGPQGGPAPINARSDTVAEKPAFRAAFRQRRCLVPADGFIEWRTENGPKQPFLFRRRDERPFAFAGLWERWEGPDGALETFAFLTTEPNALVATVHDRMPVILPEDLYTVWLDGTLRDPARLQPLLAPYPAEAMKSHPIDARVGSPAWDTPDVLQPVSLTEQLRLF